MTDLALRPRSSTELVDAAFQVFKRDPMQFILTAALVYVPWLVVRLVFDLGVSGRVPGAGQIIATLVGVLGVYAIAGGAVAQVASDVYLDRPADIARAFRVVADRAVSLLVSTFIVFVAVFVAAIFLLLPALYPLAGFFAVRQAIVIEQAGLDRALSRSWQLSVDTKRHILNTLLLVVLLTAAISYGAIFLVSVVPSRIVQNVVATAVSTVVYPLFGITETLLYYDVRIRKEGFDVEYLAAVDANAIPLSGGAT